MADNAKHVFISYVHENGAQVDRLVEVLKAAGVPYWRDRSALGPGDVWKAKIREAINNDAMVFLACFSDESRAKDRSWMNEELTEAVGQFRMMPPGRTFLIPIRFDEGEIPYWDLGAGRALRDLNYLDLFGSDYAVNVTQLVVKIQNLLGEKQPSAANALAAVEQANSVDRAVMLKRMTKEMIVDPQKRVQMDDLISGEVGRVLAMLKDEGRVAGPMAGSADEQTVQVVEEAQAFVQAVMPFCASLQVACRWGSPADLTPWVSGLRAFVTAAGKTVGGYQVLVMLRHVPGLFAVMTAALACTESGRWDNFKALLVDPLVPVAHYPERIPLLEATDPYSCFAIDSAAEQVVLTAATQDLPPSEALTAYKEGRRKLYTPIANWMFSELRDIFLDQLPDDDTYGAEFDRAEVALGLVSSDIISARQAANPEERQWIRTRWFGRSLWRVRHHTGNPLADFIGASEQAGSGWGPLQAGLFGTDKSRFDATAEKYADEFAQWSKGMW